MGGSGRCRDPSILSWPYRMLRAEGVELKPSAA